jgi:uracil-DNA glycosylase family 4
MTDFRLFAHCDECTLRGPRVVLGTGKVPTNLVLVGEGPGIYETAQGKPFVGASGKLLREGLRVAGVDDSEVYITNCVLCRPPNNRTPEPQELECCRGRLFAELKAVSAPGAIIVALGNTALGVLSGQKKPKITQQRGRLFEWCGYKVLPTFHPALVLRRPSDYPLLKGDLAYAARLSQGEKPREEADVDFHVVEKHEMRTAVNLVKSCKYVGADIETSGFNPRKHRVLCLGIAIEDDKALIFPDTLLTDSECFEYFIEMFKADTRFIWHNGKFDSEFLYRMGIRTRVDEDLMLCHYALDETKGTHGLEQLAANLLGAPDYEAEIKKYLPSKDTSYEVIPRPVLYKYLARDCGYTRACWRILRPKVLYDPPLEHLYSDTLMPASPFLQGVQRNGIHVDQEHLDQLGQELSADLQQHVKYVREITAPYWSSKAYVLQTGAKKEPPEFLPTSPQQLAWLIFRRLKLSPPKGYKADTKAETLEKMRDAQPVGSLNANVLDTILKMRKVQKMFGTYVKGVRKNLQDDGRVHPSYLIHGTVTGRLSAKEPNVQNIPRESRIRRIFNAAPGTILLEADYSQAELRVLAHLSGDEKLKQIYRDGRDLHDEVSLQLYGPNFTPEQRMRAKAANFGIAYGRTAISFVYEFGMTLEEAQALIDGWLNQFPQARDYLADCATAVLRGRVLETPFGRRRRFGLVTQESLHMIQNESRNFAIQSVASDLTLHSAMRIQPQLPEGGMIVNLVHDSILHQLPLDAGAILMAARMALRTMKYTAEELLQTDFPFEADAKIGFSWGDMKKIPLLKDLEAMSVDDLRQWIGEELEVAL